MAGMRWPTRAGKGGKSPGAKQPPLSPSSPWGSRRLSARASPRHPNQGSSSPGPVSVPGVSNPSWPPLEPQPSPGPAALRDQGDTRDLPALGLGPAGRGWLLRYLWGESLFSKSAVSTEGQGDRLPSLKEQPIQALQRHKPDTQPGDGRGELGQVGTEAHAQSEATPGAEGPNTACRC